MALGDWAKRATGRYMTDVCTITRADTDLRNRSHDPVTKALLPAATSEVYQGPCLFTTPTVIADADRAGDTVNATRIELRIPIDADPVQIGDTVRCDTSDLNPDLAGLEGVVDELDRRSIQASRRLVVTVYERTR